MFKSILLLLSALFILNGCEKPVSNPETLDPIYKDLSNELAFGEGLLQQEVANLESLNKELQDVIPQTGQIKFAKKRIYESEAKIDRYRQTIKYLTIKKAQRLKAAREQYEIAFKNKKAWPDPAESEKYMAEKRLRVQKRENDNKKASEEAPAANH